ncbi:hypothetical protein, partial [Streptomyces sp. YS-3]|uniref:hypothetical protein n=1 Tax=Streptomyces sp. YS-3 TaxID=3381352 RepID=UPI0038624EBA
MSDPTRIFRYLEDFFARAGARSRYADYDLAAAEGRLLRKQHRHESRSAATGGNSALLEPWSCPYLPGTWGSSGADGPVDAEDARQELTALSVLVVCGPGAPEQLGDFIRSHHADWQGALVFACLLYLADRYDGARFWWQFAAYASEGEDGDGAAYCLFLDHSRRGEYEDAELWARRLTQPRLRPRPSTRDNAGAPMLPAVRPGRVLACVEEHHHEDVGPIPLPRCSLVAALTAFVRSIPAELRAMPRPPRAAKPAAGAQRLPAWPGGMYLPV